MAFYQTGYQVLALSRQGKAMLEPHWSIEQRAVDALQLEALMQATQGADFIFNALNLPMPQWKKSALLLADNVIQAAKVQQATHLFPGNVYNYGSTIPALCTPTTPFAPDHTKAQIRVAMEQRFQQAAHTQQVQTLIIRAGDFYGGTQTGTWFDAVITAKLKKHIFTYTGDPALIHAWAYVPDLASAFVALAEQASHCDSFETFLYPGHSLTGLGFKAGQSGLNNFQGL